MENFPVLRSVKELKPEFKTLSTILIDSYEFTIGRGLDNSVVIAFISLSRKHCILRQCEQGSWSIEDISAGGIRLNNCKIKKGLRHNLNHNDTIQLDVGGEFIYKFDIDLDHDEPPAKRICTDTLESVKLKFEQSQNVVVETMKSRLENVQHMNNTSLILKSKLVKEMKLRQDEMERILSDRLEQLKGEQKEIEKQREELQTEHNIKLAQLTEETNSKIKKLQETIDKNEEKEARLLEENNSLKERLVREREQFMEQLNKENQSRQSIMVQLERKLAEVEAERKKEREILEVTLRKETEQLILAKENEIKTIECQMKNDRSLREQELEKLKRSLEDQYAVTAEERCKLEKEYQDRLEQVTKASLEDKAKMDELCKAREEAERKLKETEENTALSIINIKKEVEDKEADLSKLMDAKLQEKTEQYNEQITVLQNQINKMKSELDTVEIEKALLRETLEYEAAGSSKESVKKIVLTEFGEMMESELQCSICSDLFIAAVTLKCSHTFCKFCITQWKKKKNECPICRASIISECRSLVIDSFIEKVVANLTDEMKAKRFQVLHDRQEIERVTATNSNTTSGGDGFYYTDTENSDQSIEEEEREGEEEYLYDWHPGYHYYTYDNTSDESNIYDLF